MPSKKEAERKPNQNRLGMPKPKPKSCFSMEIQEEESSIQIIDDKETEAEPKPASAASSPVDASPTTRTADVGVFPTHIGGNEANSMAGENDGVRGSSEVMDWMES
ncbi:hypothetical protein Ancab_012690 [Ancistrocladus abbreviatus]